MLREARAVLPGRGHRREGGVGGGPVQPAVVVLVDIPSAERSME